MTINIRSSSAVRPLLSFLKRTNPAPITTASPSTHLSPATTTPSQPHNNQHHQRRNAHFNRPPRPIPQPTPFVPDAATFLKLIGRSMSQHASKFESWSALFSLRSPQLAELGIEPVRQRRYLLRWREKFRRGEWGVGGDLTYVEDGVGYVGVVEVPWVDRGSKTNAEGATGEGEVEAKTPLEREADPPATMNSTTPSMHKRVVSLPPGTEPRPSAEVIGALKTTEPVHGMKIRSSHICGPYVELVKDSGGQLGLIRVQEGMWEHKRGQKVDGGERRRAEVRAKKRSAERRAEAG